MSEQKWIDFCKQEGIDRGQLEGHFESEHLGVLDMKEKTRTTAPRQRKNRTQWWRGTDGKAATP